MHRNLKSRFAPQLKIAKKTSKAPQFGI